VWSIPGTQPYNAWRLIQRKTHDVAEISVEGDEYATGFDGELPDKSVISTTQADIQCRHRVMSCLPQADRVRGRKILVEQQFHALASTTSSVANWEA
jgi:hypothetical protein